MDYTVQILAPLEINRLLEKDEVKYIRLGTVLPGANGGWNKPFMEDTARKILESGKIPQLILPLAALNDREKQYLGDVREMLDKYPSAQAVLSTWGQVDTDLKNVKIASKHLNVTNSEELNLLSEYGISVVSLPEDLDNCTVERLLGLPRAVELELHVKGPCSLFWGWGNYPLSFDLSVKSEFIGEDWPIKTNQRILEAVPPKDKEIPGGNFRWLVSLFSEEDYHKERKK